MSVMLELLGLGVNSTYTGSVYWSAYTSGATPNQTEPGQVSSMSTGSWLGLDNTWGSTPLNQNLTASLSEGIWGGIDYSWGTYHIPTESFDRSDVTSNAFPLVDQGISPGDWDPFPIPVPPPAPPLPPRDLTRYKKAYSFSRHQPVRIRLVKP